MTTDSDWSKTGALPWSGITDAKNIRYVCGYCGLNVGSAKGWTTMKQPHVANIRTCPHCNSPTFFSAQQTQHPGPILGGNVEALEENVSKLYDEARSSLSVNAFTGTVMLCRKILMNVSVEKGAEEDKSFAYYVDWLVNNGYAPKGSEPWVTFIRERGNEANHQIELKTQDDARGVLRLTEQLLRNVFELPGLVPPKQAQGM